MFSWRVRRLPDTYAEILVGQIWVFRWRVRCLPDADAEIFVGQIWVFRWRVKWLPVQMLMSWLDRYGC